MTHRRRRRRLLLLAVVAALVGGIAAFRSRVLAKRAEEFYETYGR
jgi:hypothetical protein